MAYGCVISKEDNLTTQYLAISNHASLSQRGKIYFKYTISRIRAASQNTSITKMLELYLTDV